MIWILFGVWGVGVLLLLCFWVTIPPPRELRLQESILIAIWPVAIGIQRLAEWWGNRQISNKQCIELEKRLGLRKQDGKES